MLIRSVGSGEHEHARGDPSDAVDHQCSSLLDLLHLRRMLTKVFMYFFDAGVAEREARTSSSNPGKLSFGRDESLFDPRRSDENLVLLMRLDCCCFATNSSCVKILWVAL